MGAVFFVPWAWMNGSLSDLGKLGFRTAAMALTDDSIPIDNPALVNESKLAIVMGNEVKGVQQNVVDNCDICIEIPQYGTKHSLNVSVTTGIVIWDFFKQLSD